MLDKEQEGTRNLLRKSTIAGAPAGLEDRVLLKIAEIADEKAKMRANSAGLLKFIAIGLVLIAIGQSFFPGGSAKAVIATADQIVEHPGEKLGWLMENAYLLIPLFAVFVFSKLYRLKAG